MQQPRPPPPHQDAVKAMNFLMKKMREEVANPNKKESGVAIANFLVFVDVNMFGPSAGLVARLRDKVVQAETPMDEDSELLADIFALCIQLRDQIEANNNLQQQPPPPPPQANHIVPNIVVTQPPAYPVSFFVLYFFLN